MKVGTKDLAWSNVEALVKHCNIEGLAFKTHPTLDPETIKCWTSDIRYYPFILSLGNRSVEVDMPAVECKGLKEGGAWIIRVGNRRRSWAMSVSAIQLALKGQ